MLSTPGYILKYERAVQHLRTLHRSSEEWFAAEVYDIVHEKDPDCANGARVRLILPNPRPIPESMSVLIGDILYNFRSCLDNLAFELNKYKPAHGIDLDSEFPIFGNEKANGLPICNGAIVFREKIDKKTAGMQDEARCCIEQLQPFQKGKDYHRDGLWILHKLCNLDKHRSVHLTICIYHGANVQSLPGYDLSTISLADCDIHIGPLTTDTIVFRYPLSGMRENPLSTLSFKPSLQVGFAEGLCKHSSAVGRLNIVGLFVLHAIKSLSPYLPKESQPPDWFPSHG